MTPKIGDQLPLALPHRESLSGEDFLVAPCNEEAVAWMDRWPNWPDGRLCLVGPKASGKTHLASVHQAQNNAHLVTVEDLRNTPASDIASRAEAVIIDGMDRVLGPDLEEPLFHLLNAALSQGVSVLLTAVAAPKHWPVGLSDLASRLNAMAVAEIKEPDDQILAALLVKLFHDRQLRVSADVLTYLISRMERTFEAANQLAADLDEASLAGKRPVTVPLARSILDSTDA